MTEQELKLAAIMAADAKEQRIRTTRDQSLLGTGTVYNADGDALGLRPRRPLTPEQKAKRKAVWTDDRRREQAHKALGRAPTTAELESMEKRRLRRARNREREAAKAAGHPLPDLRKARPSKATPTPTPTRERRKSTRLYASKYATDADRVEARRIRDTRARRLAGVPARHFVKRTGQK